MPSMALSQKLHPYAVVIVVWIFVLYFPELKQYFPGQLQYPLCNISIITIAVYIRLT